MTTIVREAEGCIAYTKGSPEKVFRSGNLPEIVRREIEAQIEEYQKKACRVIAFAHRVLAGCSIEDGCPVLDEETVERGMTLDGFVAISDMLRADVYEAVENCRGAGGRRFENPDGR